MIRALWTDLALDEEQGRLLLWLARKHVATDIVAAAALGTTPPRAYTKLRALLGKGLVVVVGEPPTHKQTMYAVSAWGQLALHRHAQ